MAMTSRERILTAFEHREPDRVPTFIWINGEAMERVIEHLGVEDAAEAHRRLRIDRWEGVGLSSSRPEEVQDQIEALVPDEYKDDERFEVQWSGRVVRVHQGSHYLDDPVWLPLADAEEPEDLEPYPLPRPEWVSMPEDLPAQVRSLQDDGALVMGHLEQPFKSAWLLRGMDDVLMDYVIRPELLDALYDCFYGVAVRRGELFAQAGVDLIQITGDLAMQDRMIMSPDAWRRFDRERLREVISRIKAANPDTRVMMHTDGDCRAIVDNLIDCGLEVLNPIQPECMDPAKFKQRWGDRLVMHGCVSLQRSLPFGEPADVDREIKHLIDRCGIGGGLCLGPSNVIFKEIPPENVVALYDAVQRHS